MNISVFACVDFPEGPATTSRIKLLTKILTSAGHHVSLAIYNANAKNPIPENRSAHGCFDSVEFTYLSGNVVRPSRFHDVVVDSVSGIARSISFLRDKKKKHEVDAVLFYTPDILRSLPCLLQSRMYGIPILVELCEVFSSDMRKSGVKSTVQRLGSRFLDRILPGMCSGVLAISTGIIEYLRQRGMQKDRIMHLPILVDCERFMRSSGSPVPTLSEKQYMLNSGALDGKEGLEFVLEAFASISAANDQLFLVLTGAPDSGRKMYIHTIAKRLGVDQKLLFTGFLPVDQLVWAYQNARALICCRADTTFANYGFPTKLAEYLCSGSPVITNQVGDTALYLQDGQNAFITRAQDSGSIAAAMQKVLDFPDLAAEVGRNGQKVALVNFEYSNFIRPLDGFLLTVCPHSARKATNCN